MKKNTANRLEWVFLIACVILFITFLSSCRARETTIKTNTETKANVLEDIVSGSDIQTDTQKIENMEESQVKESQSAQSEDISVTHKTVKYDTDKPIDPTTGKHPIKEETYTTINKQAKEESKQSQQSTKDRSSIETIQLRVKQLVKSNTQSSLHYTAKNETKEKDGLSPIQKGLIALGLFFLGGLGFGVYRRIKEYRKKHYL